LLGDTSGSLLATSTHDSELFVLQIDPQGNVPTPTEVSKQEHTGGDVSVGTPMTTTTTMGGDDATSESDSDAGTNNNNNNDTATISNDKNGSNHRFFFVGMISFLAALLCIGYRLQDQETEKVTERALVFSYLQEFDLEDVDVRNSATGGWHGTYVGKLVKGNDSEKYSHSSLVKNSMFVDYDMSTTTTTTSLDPEDTAFYEKERDTDEEDEDDNSWGRG
jgi:hypothetical protein